ncbi:MAG: hypothetical protein N4A63_12980 [Vallitalea sp.]|jgi:hypothetical protein|nr:hypothetical protein [Vallitalea sp.]
MNLIDARVTKVLSKPKLVEYAICSWWEVKVEYVDMGGKKTKDLIFLKEEEVKEVEVGYVFQH